MRKTLIISKRYFKLFAMFILLSIIVFLILNQFVIRHTINDFINIDIDEIREVKIIQNDISVITYENTYASKEFNIKNDKEIKSFISDINEISLKRDFQNEILYNLGQWVSYPSTTSSITYKIYIKTINKAINVELTSGNTYIDLNVSELKENRYDKQYYFKIVDGSDEKLSKEIFELFN
ncbi:hypothetical protein [Brassicibacter mesophilus]|uniref:hypothetical protein n=1 Tax=Brassicibacter mesophilus TaxID=745119 RepID=UPI003D2494D3